MHECGESVVCPKQVGLGWLERETFESRRGVANIGIESKAPHVLGDDEKRDTVWRRAVQRNDQHDGKLGSTSQVPGRFVHEHLAIRFSDVNEHFLAKHERERDRVESVEPARKRVVRIDHRQSAINDALDFLPLWVGIDGHA